MKFSNIVLILTVMCLVLAQNTFALRLGGGKSYGMKHTYSQQNYSQSRLPQGGATVQQQPSRMGAGTAAVIGGVAGAAGGYMLGKSMANNNYESAQQQGNTSATIADNDSHIPWGIIAILGIFLVFGLMFFRRGKANPGLYGNPGAPINPFTFSGNNNILQNSVQPTKSANPTQAKVINMTMNSMDKMPDGIENIYFLRQAKGMFLHVQSMNNPENITEIEKYMIPELYCQIKDSINNNTSIADFTNLDCQLLNCETRGKEIIASVKFFGFVSEDPTKAPVAFSEIWNFIKTDLNASRWLIAGIEQESIN